MINSILALIGISSQPKKITRLGKKMENKPRTLKIEMWAIQEVESLMANLSRLKGLSDEFGKISVTEDYTKNEREVIKRWGGPELHLQNKRYFKKRVTPGEVRQAMNRMQCTKNDKNVKNGLSSKFKHNNGKCCNNRKLQAMYTNADQFLNKRDELVESITGNEPDIIMITEVIPKAQLNPIEASLLEIDGYATHTNFDPSEANLGASGIRGVAIYTKEDLCVNVVDFTTDFKDHIWAEIHLSDHDSLLIGCIYRSHTREKDATLNSILQVCELLSKAVERKNTYLLICGDFNYQEIDWENESSDEKNEHLTTFINTVQDCFLHQHVTENTRFRLGEEPSLLDLIFTNEEGLIRI